MNDFDYVGITPEQFRKYLPGACKWAVEQERFILQQGVPLTDAQCSDAEGEVSDTELFRALTEAQRSPSVQDQVGKLRQSFRIVKR